MLSSDCLVHLLSCISIGNVDYDVVGLHGNRGISCILSVHDSREAYMDFIVHCKNSDTVLISGDMSV